MIIKNKLWAIFIASSLILTECAWAGIKVVTSSLPSISYTGSYAIQRDAPIGTIIAYRESYITAKLERFCTGDVKENLYVTISPLKPSLGVFGNNNIPVYMTNVPGVGVRWFSYYAKGGGIKSPDVYFATDTGQLTAYIGMELVKTGRITPAVINGDSLAAVGIWENGCTKNMPIGNLMFSGGGSITQVSCSVSASNISVPLGDVLATKFTGVGATPVTKGFNLGLNCDVNAKVNVSLSGIANSDIANSDILALTNAGTAGVADGLGVQILYNGAPLKRDTNLLLKTSAGGVETLPFSARYFQTKSAVKPGKANATATLNLTYQ
ncbi:TPA: fimbrial protein [Serratia odorifera]|nr:type 1 fimbrial protein [Serratia odorifera]